jgi:Zn-dependent protease with chaperone function
LLAAGLLLLPGAASRAQTSADQAASPAAAPATPSEAPESYQPPPAAAAEAIAYSRAQHHLYFFDLAYGFLILIVVLEFRVAPRFRDWAERATPRRFFQAVLYAPLLLLTIDVVSLPTSIWQQCLELKFHQSIESWSAWFLDWLKGEALGMLLAIFLVWILYAILRRSPRRWWFYFWLASLPILIFLLFITPFMLEPLFFEFKPLAQTQPTLAAQIQQLAHHGGLDIPQSRIYEMTASAKLKSVNAYVTGIGASKRVVVWDTTIARMTPNEILFVVGHEMGHYVLHHIPKGIAFSAGCWSFSFWAIAFCVRFWPGAAASGRFARPMIGLRCRFCCCCSRSLAFCSRRSTTPSAATSSIRPTNSASRPSTESYPTRRPSPRAPSKFSEKSTWRIRNLPGSTGFGSRITPRSTNGFALRAATIRGPRGRRRPS